MLKVLHISFHKGCQNDIEYVAKKLNFELTFMEYDDGISKGGDKYIVTHEKAKNSWELHKDYYNKFDCIITSDTAPISRIFLQNNWNKKLIIWICNRFDYPHFPDKGMPDEEYYNLINDVKNRPNVSIIGYTPFENYYVNIIKKLDIGDECIKPIGQIGNVYSSYTSTQVENKDKTFIIGPYHNDNLMMNLRSKVESLGIKVFNGRYNGPKDMAEFAGVIHIPYAWSNLAFFEAIQLELPLFIPSINFLKHFIHTNIDGMKKNSFFWSPPLREDVLHLSEWYCDEFKEALIYFDSWDDLKLKVNNYDFINHKKKLRVIGDNHEKKMLEKWKKIFNINILDFKFNYYSQGGEDGIIEFIFRRIMPDNKLFVEFGACDGYCCSNTRRLYDLGWNGIYIEPSKEWFPKLIKNTDPEKVLCINSFVEYEGTNTLDNIIDNTKYKDKNFDVISIDIDSFDYEVFKSMNKYLPKVIIIEVNSCHSPSNENIIDINIAKNNIGQPLKIMIKEANEKGYFPLGYTGNLILIQNKYKNLFEPFLKNTKDMYYNFLSHLEIWDWGDALEHSYNFGVKMIGNKYDFNNIELKQFYENETKESKIRRLKLANLTHSKYSGGIPSNFKFN